MNGCTIRRPLRVVLLFLFVISTACASGGGGHPGTYTRLVITGDEVREAGYRTAYEALTHHRDLVVFEQGIGFKGGNEEAFGREAQEYYVPLLVVDGNFNLGDVITTLRRIDAADIVTIRLYTSGMVPPLYRRPGAEGGVIELSTR